MAMLIHARCERCGAPAQTLETAWLCCSSCGTLIGFDFTRWLDSPQWLAFTRRAMADPAAYSARWSRHAARLGEAAQLMPLNPQAALTIGAEEALFLMGEVPSMLPPRAMENAPLRARYARWVGFELVQAHMPGKIAALYADLNKAMAAVGFGSNPDPLPRFSQALNVLRQLLHARYELGSPADPEGLSEDARFRVMASQLVSAYLQLISPEHQAQLLRQIFGESSVEVQAGSAQDYSLYFDWECPKCGLFSPQGRGTDCMTCPGCYCARRFDARVLGINAIAILCHGCGSKVELGEGVLGAQCSYCTSEVRRFIATGDAQRAIVADVKAQTAARLGIDVAATVQEAEGIGATPENRESRVRDGLIRIAQWYHMFITPKRCLGYARASLSGVDLAGFLDTTARQAQAQGPPEAAELLRSAAALLQEGGGGRAPTVPGQLPA